MNVDALLRTLNNSAVDYILIGGMNFLLRHEPELTFDVDIWVEDSEANLEALLDALKKMNAKWGITEDTWGPVPDQADWLRRQGCFCMTTRHGALDVFREIAGLEGEFSRARERASALATAAGVSFLSLSDDDMLRCQNALQPQYQKKHRMEVLENAIQARRKGEK